MIDFLKFYSVLLLWLGVVTSDACAQSRVGAPISASGTQETTSATGGGTASAKTTAPNLLPVQNYAVIDLGGPPAPGPPGHDGTPDPDFGPGLAMDDDLNLAINYTYNFEDDIVDSYAVVQTFSNGVLSTPQTYPADIIDPTKETSYFFQGVRPNGALVGQHGIKYLTGDPPPPFQNTACVLQSSGTTDFLLPSPYIQPSLETSFSTTSANNCFYTGTYFKVTQPDGTLKDDYGAAGIMFSGSKEIVFDPTLPAVVADSDTIHYERQGFAALELNDTGSGLGGSLLWDGDQQQLVPTGVPTGTNAFCLNDQNWFLEDDGGIWHAGTETKFTDFLRACR